MKQWQAVAAAAWISLAVASPALSESNANAGAASSDNERPATSWTTNEDGLTLIAESEGLRLTAYNEGATWRIGYGHSTGVTNGQTITAAEAESFLRSDVHECEVAIGNLVTVPVTQGEFSALVSLCYTTGAFAMRKATVISRLNAGDRGGAADAFMLWTKSGGKTSPLLVTRRTAEQALFMK